VRTIKFKARVKEFVGDLPPTPLLKLVPLPPTHSMRIASGARLLLLVEGTVANFAGPKIAAGQSTQGASIHVGLGNEKTARQSCEGSGGPLEQAAPAAVWLRRLVLRFGSRGR
jgi:hypothetical protein